jgi:hypothetical protein
MIKNEDDEPPSKRKRQDEKKDNNDSPYGRHIPMPTRIRHRIQTNDELNRWLLDYNLRFLLVVSAVLWGSFLIVSSI